LGSIFPGFRATYAPGVPTAEERATALVKATREDLERARARPRPSTDEKVPQNYHGGIAGKVWFLPYQDSTTQDTPEIRAAMRLMRRDGYVKAAFEPQILTVASEDWQVQAAEAGNPDSEAQADFAKAAIEDYLAGGIISLVRAICAPFGSEGHSLAEPVWGVAQKGRLAKKIICAKVGAKDTDANCGDVRLMGDEFGNVQWVEARRRPEAPKYPIDEFIYSRYLWVFDEPLGEAAYRPAYGPYWMRDTVRKLRAIHHEKKMAGMLVGEYENDDDKRALDNALAKAKSSTWMSIPAGTRVNAVQLSTASEPDYKSFDESLRDEIVTAIAFATLQIIQGNVPDARGDSKVQKSMSDLGPWLLMALTQDAVNKQFFPRLIDYNFPYPAGGGYPKLTFGAVSNSELLELAGLLQVAQQLGFTNLSKKHYAGALSLQLADPNDPDDALTPGGQGGLGGAMGGGFPPGGAGGGGGGFGDMSGQGAELSPDGFGPGGAAGQMFGEGGYGEWESFAWQAAPTHGKSGVKAVWGGPGERRPLYGAAARRALSRGNSPSPAGGAGAAPGSSAAPAAAPAPPAPKPPTAPAPAAPTVPGAGGKVRRVAKAALRAKAHAAKKTFGGLVWAAAKGGVAGSHALDKLGAALQRVPVLESVLGVGSAIRAEARRKLRQARATAALAAAGNRGAAAKRAATASAKLAGLAFEANKRKYGWSRAVAMEGAFWVAKVAMGVAAAGATVAVTGTTPAGLAAGSAGLLLGYKIAKNLISAVVSPVLRKAIEYPFRAGRGRRGAGHSPRRLARAMDRAERKGGFTAAPGALSQKAREMRAASGPGPLYVPGGTSRSRRFAEAEQIGQPSPIDLVASLREMLEADAGRPLPLSDDELADYLADSMDYMDALSEGAEEDVRGAFAEAFAESTADWTDEALNAWESFGWQAGRTRRQTLKAVGTGPDQGKTLYGARAREALARTSGASKRQDAPRSVRYDVTDPEGNVRRKRESNVSPERARAMAVAAKVAALEPVAGPRPTDVKVSRQRPPRDPNRKPAALAAAVAPVVEAAGKAVAGDERAKAQVQDAGRKAVEQAAAGAKASPLQPADLPRVKAAWTKAALGLARPVRRELGAMVSDVTRGFAEDVEAAVGAVGKLAAWLGRQSFHVARGAVGAIAKFARRMARLAGPAFGRLAGLSWRGTKALARGAYAVGRTVTREVGGEALRAGGAALRGLGAAAGAAGRFGAKFLGPAAWYLGGALAAAAVVAAPVLAFNAGLVPFAAALAVAPLSTLAGFLTLRKTFRQGSRAVGQAFFGYHPERYGIKRAAAPFDGYAESYYGDADEIDFRFGEGAGLLFECFAWDEWTQVQGNKWKSPGGRVLSNESYQRLKGRAKKSSAGAPPPVAKTPEGATGPHFLPPAFPEPGRVYQVAPNEIAVDPARFQFKLHTDERGVTKELAHVGKFDPELAGVVAVWKDPANGVTYVVNGHHRLELARRTGARELAVRYLNAKTAEEARAKGALINIAEGRGTAVDAAKFLRDTGRSADDLAAVGVSLKGQVAKDAVELSKLSPDLFRKVAVGMVDPERGVAVAKHLPDHLDQQRLLSAVEKQEEKTGRPVSNRVVEAMAQEMRESPKVGRTQETLFGPIEQDESVYFHRAELKSYIRNELAKEARDFRLGASARRADALKAVSGNSLATEENKKVADRADRNLESFDAGARLKGPLSDLLNTYATEYADADTAGRARLRQAALSAVRELLSGGQPGKPPDVGKRGPGLFE
jgi:hypothetical protein